MLLYSQLKQWYVLVTTFAILAVTQLRASPFDTQQKCPSRMTPDLVLDRFTGDDRRVFYVDPARGSDSWIGSFINHDGGNNGPFATLWGAVMSMRSQRRRKGWAKATLFLRGGKHFLDRRLRLDNREAGLSIVSYPLDSEQAVISGARIFKASEFTTNDDRIFYVPFDGECSNHVFLGSKRMVKARQPNLNEWNGENLSGEGPYLTTADLLVSTPDCDRQGSGGFRQNCHPQNKNGFVYQPGDINPAWFPPNTDTTGQIIVFHAWNAERGRIGFINPVENKVFFNPSLRYAIGTHPKPSGFRYILENIREVLDAEGEFYCDREARLLYIIPPPGALDSSDVYMAERDTLVVVTGTADIFLYGLEFHCTNDNNREGFISMPAALKMLNSRRLKVEDCTFRNIGYSAIYVDKCYDVKITNSRFTDIGYIGITTKHRDGLEKKELANRKILIEKNTFKGCGVINMLQPACMLIAGYEDIHVKKNDVSLTPYAGMRIGWQQPFTLDYVESGKYVFYVEENNVYNFGKKILNDFGGIYLSANPDCAQVNADYTRCHLHALVSRNAVYDSSSFNYGGLGMHGDSGVSSVTVTENWFYDLADCAVNYRCGLNNRALNNMIYHVNDNRVFGTCKFTNNDGRPHQTVSFKQNVVYVNNLDARMFGRSDFWVNDVPCVDRQAYFFEQNDTTQLMEFFPIDNNWHDWRQNTGNDLNSVIADPEFSFVDIEKDDYRLRDDSPALGVGIKSVDLRNVQQNSGACN